MLRIGRYLAAALAVCVLVATAARAGVGFQPVSPEELKMTSESLAPGAPAIILYRQVDRDDNGRTSHEDHYFRIKILTEEGRKYANVEIPFLKDVENIVTVTNTENIVNIKARTIKPDGSIVPFDGKVYEKTIVKAKGTKYLAKTFTLPDVQAGAIIEYSYSIDFVEFYLFNSHWMLSDELFTKKAQFSLKPYAPKAYQSYFPNAFRLRWTFQRLPPGAEAKQGPDGIVRMEANNIPAFPTEDLMPPADELKARVDFIYEETSSEREAEKYWRHFGKTRNASLEAFAEKRKAMEAAVAQITSPGDTPEVKLRKIYDRVLAMRNTSFEIEKTEQEQKRAKENQLDNVEEVWKRGYGDAHALSRLFLALARAAGFDARECWVSDRSNYFFVPLTMESSKLDSNVVVVKLNDKPIYFDPGVPFTPFGMLPWSRTGTQGLLLDKDGGTWVRTPLPLHSESRIERNAKLKLSDTGDLEGKLTITYAGVEGMLPRLRERHADDVARKKFLEDGLKEQIPVGAEVELDNKPDWSSAETPLVAEFTVKIPGWASAAGKRAAFPVGIFTAAEKRVFEHSRRVHPIYFAYSFEKVDDITIEIPAGWRTTSVPIAQTKDGHVITYSLKVDDNNGTLHLTRKFTVDGGMFDPKYYDGLRGFFQLVRSGDEEQVVLQPGEIHASK